MQPLSWSDALFLFIPLFLVSTLAIVPAVLAQRKGYNFWLAYSFGVVIWLVTMLVVVLLPAKDALKGNQKVSGYKPCPACGEDNEIARRSCARCRKTFAP